MTPRSLALATPFVLLGLASLLSPGNTAPTTHHAAMNQATEAVEPDMHEFMEYYFQPTYRRLKETMAAAPADNAGWKAIKADSIILAESGNLLIGRGPEDRRGTKSPSKSAMQEPSFTAPRKPKISMLLASTMKR